MRTHYGPWQPCWISNQHQKHKSGRGPSSEHFWQVWLISVQRFQRRRFKCEKLTDGRRTLTHDKSSHGLWPGELKMTTNEISIFSNSSHFEWRAGLSDTLLKGDHPRTIPAKFALIWFSGFRGKDLNVIAYHNMPNFYNRY